MKNKEVEVVKIQLDEELMGKLADKICQAIEDVIHTEEDDTKDPRIEIFTILLWLAAGVAQELGVERSSFLEIAEDSFDSNDEEPVVLN